MTAKDESTVDEQQIRALVESCARAIGKKDADGVAAHFAPDMVAFDMMPPLHVDVLGYRQNYAQWFAGIEGPIDYEVGHLKIVAGGDAGWCTMINRVSFTAKNGEKSDGRVRVTLGLRKVNGKWLAAHEHVSVPFDMTTGQALMTLTP